MTFEQWMTAAAFIASVVALFFSYVSWRLSHKTERRMVEIEEARDRAVERQSAKAHVMARLERNERQIAFPGSNPVNRMSVVLYVENRGPSPARDVRIVVNGADVTAEAKTACDESGRIQVLHPGALAVIQYGDVLWGFTMPKRARIEWTDDSGEAGTYESDL